MCFWVYVYDTLSATEPLSELWSMACAAQSIYPWGHADVNMMRVLTSADHARDLHTLPLHTYRRASFTQKWGSRHGSSYTRNSSKLEPALISCLKSTRSHHWVGFRFLIGFHARSVPLGEVYTRISLFPSLLLFESVIYFKLVAKFIPLCGTVWFSGSTYLPLHSF